MKPEDIVSDVLKAIVKKAAVGVNLLDLEKTADTMITLYGAVSANLNYKPAWATSPFPSVLCLGVNDVIAHAIVKDYTLKDGDLLHVDCGIIINGKAGDAGLTIPIGEVSSKDRNLLKYTKRALYEGIKVVRSGIKVTEIGRAIEHYAKSRGYVVNRSLHGHGIGQQMHEEPSIPHFDIGMEEIKEGKKYRYKEYDNVPTLYEGQIICIEPHLTYKDAFGFKDSDGWTFRTRDGRNSAFFENMIRVTSLGAEVLTSHIKEG